MTTSLSIQSPEVPSVYGMEDLQDTLGAILEDAIALKKLGAQGAIPQVLAGKAVALVFEKNSTRTRISFEVGVQRLGGMVTTLDTASSQLSRGESIEDTAGTLGRFVDLIVHRALTHDRMVAMAKYSGVPVVNALTEREHPCQVVADWMALKEHWGTLAGKTFTYVGDGNNMCHSYLLAAPMVGMNIRVATPPDFAPNAEILARAKELAVQAGTTVEWFPTMAEVLPGSDAVATDTWISMGDEGEEAERLRAFEDFRLTDDHLDLAGPEAVFMHCMPGHWGEEATYKLAHGPRSLIFEEAENRMWAQMAILARLAQA